MNAEGLGLETPLLKNEIPSFSSLDNPICPIFVGIAGGSASGKTTLCNTIMSEIGKNNCLLISLDSFYKPLTEEEAIGFNFDHPDAFDFELCYEVIKKLLTRQETEIPIYNFKTNTRENITEKVRPTELIFLEGILALYYPKLVSLMNVKLFVDCDNDIRLSRRVLRDVRERGREVNGILYQYNKFVKPAFDELIKPTMAHANLIIPGRSDNKVAIKFIIQNLKLQLARLKEMREGMDSGAYYADILDSCWLNLKQNNDLDTDDLKLHQSDKILFLKESQVKIDCLKTFNFFSNKFTESLFMSLMMRLLHPAIKLMTENEACKSKPCRMKYFMDILPTEDQCLDQTKVVGIIVPFLYNDTLESVEQQIDKLLTKKPKLTIFVISIFADISTIGSLSKWKKNIYLVNILCIVNMRGLLERLKGNCEREDFDFLKDEVFVQLIIDTSRNEILNEEKKLHKKSIDK